MVTPPCVKVTKNVPPRVELLEAEVAHLQKHVIETATPSVMGAWAGRRGQSPLGLVDGFLESGADAGGVGQEDVHVIVLSGDLVRVRDVAPDELEGSRSSGHGG